MSPSSCSLVPGRATTAAAFSLGLLAAASLKLEAIHPVFVQLLLRRSASPGAAYVKAHTVLLCGVEHGVEGVRRARVEEIARSRRARSRPRTRPRAVRGARDGYLPVVLGRAARARAWVSAPPVGEGEAMSVIGASGEGCAGRLARVAGEPADLERKYGEQYKYSRYFPVLQAYFTSERVRERSTSRLGPASS